ncbi:MAG: NAD(P)/FAD-dependent oxidoreductase, partial [Jiangellaceae bacterium]
MTAPQRFVIVGAGLAGAKAAETLRDEGVTGPVRLIGTESEPPYERPPLSKQYLAGTAERDTIFVHGPDWYDEHDIELSLGTAAVDLDVEAHEVTLSTGEKVGYDKLLLATGSRARRIRIPGADLAGVRELRTVADADRLRQDLSDGGRRVVIVGAGWIGLETAAAARGFGNEVTVIEPQPVPLRAALGD